MAVLLGKHSKKCLDCIKKNIDPHKYMPKQLISYTSIQIIKMVKTGEIQSYQVLRTIPQVTKWTIINRKLHEDVLKNE